MLMLPRVSGLATQIHIVNLTIILRIILCKSQTMNSQRGEFIPKLSHWRKLFQSELSMDENDFNQGGY